MTFDEALAQLDQLEHRIAALERLQRERIREIVADEITKREATVTYRVTAHDAEGRPIEFERKEANRA